MMADLLKARQKKGRLTGELATATFPDDRLGFVVERINPVADQSKGQNVFKVRVKLDRKPSYLRPGLEGVAHVTIGKRPYYRIWTRRLVNWIKMKLWW